ncbi:metallophosphoesterase [Thermus amyloliquefaciens]|uniref:metallophosphoesterase n=1 Tax=Thermus amyloliquefaciens TaxID=1449080 RepID=UPI00056E913B|nr:metallophosphoesterase [Thermus amyloliquefaciens]
MRVLLLVLFLGWALGQRLAVIGDWGQDTPGRAQVASLLRAEHARKPMAALFTAGDNFYPRGLVVERFLRELPPIPLYPAFGNHDAPHLEAQLKRFQLESPYYQVRLGVMAFFILYTEGDLKAQREWLAQALSRTQAPWRVVILHRPLYSSGLHGGSPSLRSLLEPLLRQHRLPLVLAGHDHHYERLQVGPTTHLVVGGGGAGLYPTKPPSPYTQALAVAHHALFLEVGEETLLGYALTPEGRVLDRFTLRKGSP